jgi:hypothetical protein
MPRGRPKKDAPGNVAAPMWAGRTNKMECVRQALTQLGDDAKPKELQGFLKKTFHLDMDTKMLSTYKGMILKDAARKSAIMRPLAAGTRATPPARAVAVNGGISVDDIRAVKELVDKIGRDSLRALAEVLSK